MTKMNAVISLVCAVLWTANGFINGFDLFGICVTILWWLAAVLFNYANFKRIRAARGGKNEAAEEGKENG